MWTSHSRPCWSCCRPGDHLLTTMPMLGGSGMAWRTGGAPLGTVSCRGRRRAARGARPQRPRCRCAATRQAGGRRSPDTWTHRRGLTAMPHFDRRTILYRRLLLTNLQRSLARHGSSRIRMQTGPGQLHLTYGEHRRALPQAWHRPPTASRMQRPSAGTGSFAGRGL